MMFRQLESAFNDVSRLVRPGRRPPAGFFTGKKMALPLAAGGLLAEAGSLFESLNGQPESRRAALQLNILRNNADKLQKIAEEQTKEFSRLKIQYDIAKPYNIMHKQQLMAEIMSRILQFCCFKEYIILLKTRPGPQSFDSRKEKFFDLCNDMFIDGSDLNDENYDFFLNYLENKYQPELLAMTFPVLEF
jgi:hypothetical protein